MAATVILSGAAVAQTAPSTTMKPMSERGYSLLDLSIFGGYQWFQFGQGNNAGAHAFSGAGAWGERLTEELWPYVGIEEGIQVGYNSFQYRPLGAPSLSKASSGNVQIYGAGVLNLTKRDAKYRPFLLIGPEYVFYKAPDFAHGTIAPGTPPVIFPPLVKEQGRTALTYGIGLKINSSPRWAVRFDLRGTRSGTPHFGIPSVATVPGTVYLPAGYYHESSLTASVGLTFRFRYHEPPAPPMVMAPPAPKPPAPMAHVVVGAITGGPASVCAGENVRLSVTASGWLADQTPTYQWMVDGSPAPGAGSSTFSVPTTGAGTKSITVKVTAGDSSATSAAFSVTVQALTPPTISFGISPARVPYGTKVSLAATATGSACGGPATIRYTGTGVTGTTWDSTALTFDMANRLKEQCQTVNVTATATDQKNQTASAMAPVTACLTPQSRRLDDIIFPLNSARVNNCAKRVLLEELTPMLRNDPGSKVILIGHKDTGEKGKNLDEQRVLDSLAVLSAGSGICPSLDLSRAMVNWVGTDQNDETRPSICGTSTNVKEKGGQSVKESDKRAPFRRVEIWFVPSSADMPANLTGLKSAPEKDVKAKGCPK
jgi:opacity protein-like surface antigen